MKILLLLTSAICLALTGCNSMYNQDNVKDYIPGTYISSWKTEFSECVDTLLIESLMKRGSETFLITRRTHVNFNKNPKRGHEYRIKHLTGNYDAVNKTVVLNNDGSVLSFDPVNNEMKRGTTSYKKL